MNIEIKPMETEYEIQGKGYVHCRSWHETYTGLVDEDYLRGITEEKCDTIAHAGLTTYSWLRTDIRSWDSRDTAHIGTKPYRDTARSLQFTFWLNITERESDMS